MSRFPTATLPFVCALLCLSASAALAGPCSADIAQFEQAIRNSAGNPFAGLTAPQSLRAQINVQPTPQSVQQEQASLKAKFAALMAQAKRLDARGDRPGCSSALTQAKRMYIL